MQDYDLRLIDAVAKVLVNEWHANGFGEGGWDEQPGYARELARRQAKAALEAVENYLDGV